MDDDDTILAEEGERCINPENFSELVSTFRHVPSCHSP